MSECGSNLRSFCNHLLFLRFFNYPRPYIDNPRDNVKWLRQTSQQRAWTEHLACVGVDYLNPKTDLELGYCVLAKLVAELIDENCTAIYVPRESALAPNDELLYSQLQEMPPSRDPGVFLAT
jgi:hypothetical protein